MDWLDWVMMMMIDKVCEFHTNQGNLRLFIRPVVTSVNVVEIAV